MRFECVRVRRQLPLWVGGDLSEPGKSRVQKHVFGCEQCRQLADSLRRTRELLVCCTDDLHVDRPLWPEVEGRLGQSERFGPSRSWVPWAALAAAAVALAAWLSSYSPTTANQPIGTPPLNHWAGGSNPAADVPMPQDPNQTEQPEYLLYSQPVGARSQQDF